MALYQKASSGPPTKYVGTHTKTGLPNHGLSVLFYTYIVPLVSLDKTAVKTP